jgi:bla regulator protein BlaR1
MTAFGQSILLQALGWAVLNSLWQMALLWVIYQLIISIYKNASSHQKSTLAALILSSGFCWFVFTLISIWKSDSSSNLALVSSSFISIEGNENVNEWLQKTLPVASLLYLILLAIPAISFARNYRYVQLLHHQGISKVDVKWRMFVKHIAEQMGIKRVVPIWISDLITSPVTIGFLKPIILIPLAAINHLTPQQLEAVLLHELSHIKRHDYLINLVITFIRTVLYYNPFVKLFVKAIERERERSCDEMVMQFQYDPCGYASALLMIEKNNFISKPMLIAAGGRKNDLLYRVERILGIEKKPLFSFNRVAGLFAGLLCVIALNALLILSRPHNQNLSLSVTQFGNPFYFFPGDDADATEKPRQTVILVANKSEIVQPIINAARPKEPIHLKETVLARPGYYHVYNFSRDAKDDNESLAAPPVIMNVGFQTVEVPQLKQYQEAEVNQALILTKKVLEEKEWEKIDNNIADAMTDAEKEVVKSEYLSELGKVDWKKVEDQLRISYDKINWDKIGDKLNAAIGDIKLDSMQKVYSNVVVELNKVECLIAKNKVENILPDTDITLQKVQEKKRQTLNQLSKLRAVRSRKIVHL